MPKNNKIRFAAQYLFAMFIIALILLLSIAMVLLSSRYLDQAFSFEQSIHYVFMLLGSSALPWITQRFLHAPQPENIKAHAPTNIELPQDRGAKTIRACFYLLTLALFWAIFAPWTALMTLMQTLSQWIHSTTALLFIVAIATLMLTCILAGIMALCSRYITKMTAQPAWRSWQMSLSFAFGLLCFAQISLNMLMLKFLF